jgi:uncharacterized protein YndB with AHSA1/START domain
MSRQEIDARATTAASPDTVYELLRDGATWPVWSPLGSFELKSPGPDGGESVGAVRVFTTGRVHSQERIVELVPGERLSYVLEDGLPLREYRADIDLEPVADGTLIRWHSTFHAKVPGTGPLFRRRLGSFIQETVDGLAAYAQDPARATTSPARGSTR